MDEELKKAFELIFGTAKNRLALVKKMTDPEDSEGIEVFTSAASTANYESPEQVKNLKSAHDIVKAERVTLKEEVDNLKKSGNNLDIEKDEKYISLKADRDSIKLKLDESGDFTTMKANLDKAHKLALEEKDGVINGLRDKETSRVVDDHFSKALDDVNIKDSTDRLLVTAYLKSQVETTEKDGILDLSMKREGVPMPLKSYMEMYAKEEGKKYVTPLENSGDNLNGGSSDGNGSYNLQDDFE